VSALCISCLHHPAPFSNWCLVSENSKEIVFEDLGDDSIPNTEQENILYEISRNYQVFLESPRNKEEKRNKVKLKIVVL
jgi:hypothetical protein